MRRDPQLETSAPVHFLSLDHHPHDSDGGLCWNFIVRRTGGAFSFALLPLWNTDFPSWLHRGDKKEKFGKVGASPGCIGAGLPDECVAGILTHPRFRERQQSGERGERERERESGSRSKCQTINSINSIHTIKSPHDATVDLPVPDEITQCLTAVKPFFMGTVYVAMFATKKGFDLLLDACNGP